MLYLYTPCMRSRDDRLTAQLIPQPALSSVRGSNSTAARFTFITSVDILTLGLR